MASSILSSACVVFVSACLSSPFLSARNASGTEAGSKRGHPARVCRVHIPDTDGHPGCVHAGLTSGVVPYPREHSARSGILGALSWSERVHTAGFRVEWTLPIRHWANHTLEPLKCDNSQVHRVKEALLVPVRMFTYCNLRASLAITDSAGVERHQGRISTWTVVHICPPFHPASDWSLMRVCNGGTGPPVPNRGIPFLDASTPSIRKHKGT